MFVLLTTFSFFFFNDPATTEISTLSLHDALPIFRRALAGVVPHPPRARAVRLVPGRALGGAGRARRSRCRPSRLSPVRRIRQALRGHAFWLRSDDVVDGCGGGVVGVSVLCGRS